MGKEAGNRAFFKEIESGKFGIYISTIVRTEILAAPHEKRMLLNSYIQQYQPIQVDVDEEAESLAQAYIGHGLLSMRHYNDLLHLAVASANGMFALVIWNLNHLVKMKTYVLGNAVNLENGYPPVRIFTPQQMTEVKERDD